MNEAIWKAAAEKIRMAHNHSFGEFWLGMNDLKDGTYRYVSDGNEVVDGMWGEGEPNNAKNIEHCVCYFHPSLAQWYDRTCSTGRMSICVLPVDSAGEKTGESF